MKSLNEVHRRFLPDASHTGNVIRRIAHQRFDFDELARLYAVFRPDGRLVILRCDRLAHLCSSKQDVHAFSHKLQGIPVASGKVAQVALPTLGGKRAEDIICFVALAFHHGEAERGQQLL